MPISSRINKACILFFVLFAIAATLPSVGFGQCGVYLKPSAAQKFPYSNIYLDGAPDMTGDGKPDLFVSQNLGTGSSSNRTRLFFIPNNGDGTFAYNNPIIVDPPPGLSFVSSLYWIRFGPINNDALQDFIVPTTSGLYGYINNGNGTFTKVQLTAPTSSGSVIDFADVNGDGKGDYFGFTSGGEFRYALGNGDGSFAASILIGSRGIGYRGDFNGDGKPDFVNSVELYMNQGNGTFVTSDVSSVFTGGLVVWNVADMNVDGKSDLLIAPLGSNATFAILTSTGSAFTRTDYTVSTDPNSQGNPILGNVSGNSAPEVVYSYLSKNKKTVYHNDGAGNLTKQDYPQRFNPFADGRRVFADFDNDGKIDLVQATSKTDNYTIMLTDITSFTFKKNVCTPQGQPRIVDFDGEGITDYSYWNPATGDSFVASGVVNWGLGSLGDIFVPGDYDGDGITDRAVYRDSTGYWYIRRSSDLAWFVFKFGLSGDKPVSADFDGDSITDIAVWRPSDGNWYFWYMGTQSFSAVHFGANGDKPVPADFDGDLKTDVAVYRPSTGAWYYLKSSDGNYAVIQWGISTDKPMPADFDGDGKADIAIYRDSDHTAYILKSYDMIPAYYGFGLTGDVIQIGDFDGDFVADIGMYRPSTKAWWTTNHHITAAAVYGDTNVVPTSSIPRIE